MPASCVKPYSVQLDCISAALVSLGSVLLLLRTLMRLLAVDASLSFQPNPRQFTSSVSSAAALLASSPDFVPIVFFSAIYDLPTRQLEFRTAFVGPNMPGGNFSPARWSTRNQIVHQLGEPIEQAMQDEEDRLAAVNCLT